MSESGLNQLPRAVDSLSATANRWRRLANVVQTWCSYSPTIQRLGNAGPFRHYPLDPARAGQDIARQRGDGVEQVRVEVPCGHPGVVGVHVRGACRRPTGRDGRFGAARGKPPPSIERDAQLQCCIPAPHHPPWTRGTARGRPTPDLGPPSHFAPHGRGDSVRTRRCPHPLETGGGWFSVSRAGATAHRWAAAAAAEARWALSSGAVVVAAAGSAMDPAGRPREEVVQQPVGPASPVLVPVRRRSWMTPTGAGVRDLVDRRGGRAAAGRRHGRPPRSGRRVRRAGPRRCTPGATGVPPRVAA